MSTPTPFALEEQGQLERMPLWNPEEAQPRWYDGFGFNEDTAYLGPFYRALEAAGNGAAKGEAMLSGLWHAQYNAYASAAEALHLPGAQALRQMEQAQASVTEDARDRVKATTPDPATTGTAAQVLHGVVSGAYRAGLGALAGGPLGGAAAVGGSEGVSRFQELQEQGVDPVTAAGSAALAGVSSGAGALLPGGFGTGLITKVMTGAGANAGLGLANRYLDHQILEAGGYHDMAQQQAVWDGTQVLADTLLGAAFGGLAHAHATAEARSQAFAKSLPTWGQAAGATDAARTLEVALRDRAAAPGVPVDPASAQAHQAALEKAQTDLLSGEPVNVADTGVDQAHFLARPAPMTEEGEGIIVKALKDAGIMDEQGSLEELERALEARMRGERPVQTSARQESVTSQAPADEGGYTVGEEALTDEERQAFERRLAAQGEELPATGEGSRGQGEPGLKDDGGRGSLGSAGEPTRVYRGGRGGPLTPEHFGVESLGKATGHPSSGLGVYFTSDAGDAARYGTVTEHDLALQKPKHVPIEDLPGFDTAAEATAYREKLRAEGHDGIVIDASHLGGPKHFVAFSPEGVRPAGPRDTSPAGQALTERPGLEIAGENGQGAPAAEALRQVDADAAQGEAEAKPAIDAAVSCFSRKGGS